MNITLRGVRGSIPTTSPDTKEYGGNTSCVEVEQDGWLLVLDAGSGIQNVNMNAYLNTSRVDILLTHLHMDHIQGLGFFRPLFNPATEVHIWGPASTTQSLRARLGRYFSPPLFPVYYRDLNCRLAKDGCTDTGLCQRHGAGPPAPLGLGRHCQLAGARGWQAPLWSPHTTPGPGQVYR